MRKAMVSIVMTIGLIMMTGCSGTWDWFRTNKTPLEYAVKIAIVDLIDQGDIDGDRVVEIAQVAEQYLDANPKARAIEIVDRVHREIRWNKLSVGQTMITEAILGAVTEKIAADLERGLISDDARASVKEIIRWIKEAAVMAQARQSQSSFFLEDGMLDIVSHTVIIGHAQLPLLASKVTDSISEGAGI